MSEQESSPRTDSVTTRAAYESALRASKAIADHIATRLEGKQPPTSEDVDTCRGLAVALRQAGRAARDLSRARRQEAHAIALLADVKRIEASSGATRQTEEMKAEARAVLGNG